MTQEWYEKYAPKTLEEYVFGGEEHRDYVASCLEAGHVRPAILWGTFGVGKSSLLDPLLAACGVDRSNIWHAFKTEVGLDINAALKSLEQKAKNTDPVFFGNIYIILDEFDRLTPVQANKVQQLFDMYSAATWLFTTNNVDKVSDAMKSRCTVVHVDNPDKESLGERLSYILTQEGVSYSNNDLQSYVDPLYPSIRNIIKNLQTGSATKKLKPYTATYSKLSDKERRDIERLGRAKENVGAILQETRFNKFEIIIPTYLKRKLKESHGFQFRQTIHGYSSVVEAEGETLNDPALSGYAKSEVLIVSYTNPKQLEYEKRNSPDFKTLIDAEINSLEQANSYVELRKAVNSLKRQYSNKPEELKAELAEFYDKEFGLFSIDYKMDTGTVNGVKTSTDWINLIGARRDHPKLQESLDLVAKLALRKVRNEYVRNLSLGGIKGFLNKGEFKDAIAEIEAAASLMIEEAYEYDARITGQKYGTSDISIDALWEEFNK